METTTKQSEARVESVTAEVVREFNLDVFDSKKYMPAEDYLEFLIKRAIAAELITQEEVDKMNDGLKEYKMGIADRVKAWDTILWNKFEHQQSVEYFETQNDDANKSTSFFNSVPN